MGLKKLLEVKEFSPQKVSSHEEMRKDSLKKKTQIP